MKYSKKRLACIMAVFTFISSINVTSFATGKNDDEGEYYPKVILGSPVKEDGLRIITSFTPAVRGDRTGLISGEKAGGGNPEYINVDVDDNYMYNVPNFTPVEVTVEYFDDEQGKFNLTYNTHHIYFVASRGAEPVVDTNEHTIIFSIPRDTYWKDYEVTVVSTSNGNRAVTLDRIVTKLALKFTDAVSANASTINFTPSSWYYTLNYKTGEPTTATTSQTISTSVPASYIGNTDVLISYFSLSPSTDWTTDVNVNSIDGDNNIIGQGDMANVPLKRNRVTEYSGPLFSSGGTVTTSLNTDWITTYEGEW